MLCDGKNLFAGNGSGPALHGCGSERIVKNGKNVCGHQPFRCRACGVSRVLAP